MGSLIIFKRSPAVSIGVLAVALLLVWSADSKPSVNVFMVTFDVNTEGRVMAITSQGPFADVGFDLLQHAYGKRFNFSFDYVMPSRNDSVPAGFLGDHIENLIAKQYWTHVDSADAIAHLYSGVTMLS